MADWKHTLLEHMPFILAARPLGDSRVNTTRILESLIIAGITGGIVMYGVQQKLDAQMAELKTQMAELKARYTEDRAEASIRSRRIEDRIDAFHATPIRPR